MAQTVGFIGGGNMAYAIGGGFVTKGLCEPANIWVSGPHIENLGRWKKLGVNITTDNGMVMSMCDIVVLAVKPHLLDVAVAGCLETYKSTGIKALKLIISVLAGVTISTLKKKLNVFDGPRIIRTLPNTSLFVGDGVVLYCCDSLATKEDCLWMGTKLGALGLCEKVNEDAIDILGALSGCGPAFMMLVFESLVNGAVGKGATRDVAKRVTAHMMRGVGSLLCHPTMKERHSAELKDEVTSSGGSTAAGLAVLEKNTVRSAFMQAIDASAEKSLLLGMKKE